MTESQKRLIYYYSLNPTWEAMHSAFLTQRLPEETGFTMEEAEAMVAKWKDMGLAPVFIQDTDTGFPLWLPRVIAAHSREAEKPMNGPHMLVGVCDEEGKLICHPDGFNISACVFTDDPVICPALEKAEMNHAWYDASTKILHCKHCGSRPYYTRLLLEFEDARSFAAVACNIFVTFQGDEEFAKVRDYGFLQYFKVNHRKYLAVPGVSGSNCNKLIKSRDWELCDSIADIKEAYRRSRED